MTHWCENFRSKAQNAFTSFRTTMSVGGCQIVLGIGLLVVYTYVKLGEPFMQAAVGAILEDLGVWMLLSFALALIVIGTFGCLSAKTGNKKLAIAYDILSQLVAVAKIAVTVTLAFNFESKIDEGVTEFAYQAVRQLYGTYPWATKAVDNIQRQFECCGAMGHDSWTLSNFNGYASVHPFFDTRYDIPETCCLAPGSARCDTGRDVRLTAIQLRDTIYTEGCIPKIVEYVKSKIPYFMYVSVLFSFVELAVGLVGVIMQSSAFIDDKLGITDEENVAASDYEPRSKKKHSLVRMEKEYPY